MQKLFKKCEYKCTQFSNPKQVDILDVPRWISSFSTKINHLIQCQFAENDSSSEFDTRICLTSKTDPCMVVKKKCFPWIKITKYKKEFTSTNSVTLNFYLTYWSYLFIQYFVAAIAFILQWRMLWTILNEHPISGAWNIPSVSPFGGVKHIQKKVSLVWHLTGEVPVLEV